MTQNILFICSGNTCRSPMAETIFRQMIKQEKTLSGRFSVDSAGTNAINDLPATSEAKWVMEELGLSLENHRSKKVSKELVDKSDLILVMDSKNKNRLLRNFDQANNKTYLLSEFVGEHDQIIDPFNKGIDIYKSTVKQIEGYLIKLKRKLSK